jgi:hypothetical protein
MEKALPPELATLDSELEAIARDAEALVAGMSAGTGEARVAPGSWSVAECLDHLAVSSRVYIPAMREAADAARRRGRLRRGPAVPGVLGRWFINSLEPPVKPRTRSKAPGKIAPRSSPPLAAALAAFTAAHADARAFLLDVADLDLNGTRFRNPFIPGLRFSLATGLNVIAAHDRRHLWQAWNVRRAVTSVGVQGGPATCS